MSLMGVRASIDDDGPVAVLVEDGGTGVIAVPVTAREGLALTAQPRCPGVTWPSLIERMAGALGGAVSRVELDVDADAALTSRVVLEGGKTGCVVAPCIAGEGLILAETLSVDVLASSSLLRLRGIDLSGRSRSELVGRWRQALDDQATDSAWP